MVSAAIGAAHADPDIADHQMLGPARCCRAGAEQFGGDAEGVDVERVAVGGDLLDPLVVDVVQEADGLRALRDRRRHVVGGPGDGAP